MVTGYRPVTYVAHLRSPCMKSFDQAWATLTKRLDMSWRLFHDLRRTGCVIS